MPTAFLPSSDSKQTRKFFTLKWCINVEKQVSGCWRARWAIRSTPGIAVVPPLGVVGVAIEPVVACVPLRSIGVTLLRHYYEDIRLPIDHWACFQLSGCAALPLERRNRWALPSSRLYLGHVLRSLDPGGPAKALAIGFFGVAFRFANSVGIHGFIS
jgi:hypothetical protein